MFQYHVSVAFGTGGDIKEFGVARLRLQLTSTSRKGLQIGCPRGDFLGKETVVCTYSPIVPFACGADGQGVFMGLDIVAAWNPRLARFVFVS
jgi:hypothetical protein